MSDSPTPQTIDRLADVLQRHKVEYCVIGGVAANYHGSPRVTYDIDILSRGGLENLTRLAHAITELGGRIGTRSPDADDLRNQNSRWETSIGRLDVLLAAKGPGSTRITYRNVADEVITVHTPTSDTPLQIIGPEDLLILKHATNRDHDRVDIAAVLANNPDLHDPAVAGGAPLTPPPAPGRPVRVRGR
jgi:hypothetical protein